MVLSRNLVPGVYTVVNWPQYEGMNGKQFAEAVSAQVKPLIVSNSNPKVQLDMEHVFFENDVIGSKFIVDALKRWRELHPFQDTSWTVEAMQGGWMSKEFVAAVTSAKVRVVPQCYDGDMTQVWDTLAAARDLTKRGFLDAIITPFYDAAKLPEYWNGFAFTQGRLP
jgi:hypothetical protein